MNEHFEHTLKKMRSDTLSHEEHTEMRARLRLFMAEHPVQPTAFERFAKNFTYGRARVSYARPALAGFLIVFLVGGGTSYAAADALPGDLLYAVKTRVNEPVASALAISEESKASLSATFAVRRLEEAEVLASEGRLSSAVSVEIESKFEEHLEEFEIKTTALAEKDEDIETVADAQSDLEASLKVHASVLADLSAAMPEAEEDISPIQRKVEARVQKVENARVAVENVIAKKVDRNIEKAATEKKRIVELEVSGRRASGPVAAKAAPQAETMTMMMAVSVEDAASAPDPTLAGDPAVEAFDEGSAAFEVGQYGEAFTKFQGVIRALKQEKLEQDVRKRLNFNVEHNDEEKNEWNSGPNEKKGDNENEKKDTIDEDARDEEGGEKKSSEDDDTGREASSTGSSLPIKPLLNEVPARVGL